MGNGCCQKSSVRIHVGQPTTVKPPIIKLNLENQAEQARQRKSILFQSEASENTFADLSTPRTGKIIR